MKLIKTADYLLLLDEEAEISKIGTLIYENDTNLLNITGVDYEPQGLDSKIIAYYPLTKEAKELDLPLLPNPFEKEIDVEMLADVFSTSDKVHPDDSYISKVSYIEGYKAAQSKQFSLEDMKKAIEMAQTPIETGIGDYYPNISEIIQSLSTQQLPKEFKPLIEIYDFDYGVGRKCIPKKILKTIINPKSKQVLVGNYKY